MSRVAQETVPRRSCSKQTCNRDAVCTLTYVYSDSTAVIGALSARREPHAYDLCPVHADSLTAPRGWRVVRLEFPDGWGRDDLDAVVQAVRPDEEPVVRRSPRGPSLGAARPNGPAVPGARVLRDVSYRPDAPDADADDDAARPAADGRAADAATTRPSAGAGTSTGARRGDGTRRPAELPRDDTPAGVVGRTSPGVPPADSDEYSGTRRSSVNANPRPSTTGRSVPLPAALRTPHLRRP